MKNLAEIASASLVLLILTRAAEACPWCRAQTKAGVFDGNFVGNLFILLLPVFILAGLGFGLYHADKILNIAGRLK